jgi:hypothetical protein
LWITGGLLLLSRLVIISRRPNDNEDRRAAFCFAQLPTAYFWWRPAIDLGKHRVEPTQAAEAGDERYLGHRQIRRIKQPLPPLNSRRPGDLAWACPEMPGEQSHEMPLSDPEPGGECADTRALTIERAFVNQA